MPWRVLLRLPGHGLRLVDAFEPLVQRDGTAALVRAAGHAPRFYPIAVPTDRARGRGRLG